MFHLGRAHSLNGAAFSSFSKTRHQHLPAGLRGLIRRGPGCFPSLRVIALPPRLSGRGVWRSCGGPKSVVAVCVSLMYAEGLGDPGFTAILAEAPVSL